MIEHCQMSDENPDPTYSPQFIQLSVFFRTNFVIDFTSQFANELETEDFNYNTEVYDNPLLNRFFVFLSLYVIYSTLEG